MSDLTFRAALVGAAVLLLLLGAPAAVSAGCYTFYEGLCPGPADCMCTLGEACGGTKNASAARSADGGCSGSCRQVVHDACPGDASCLKDVGPCSGPAPPPGPTPSRAQIISCAQDWCNRQVPYCQCNGPEECCGSCPYCGTPQWRCDCSGFVSYCWGLPYGYDTETLPQVSHAIAKSELQPGDVMLCVSDHVVIFGGWTDGTMSNYIAYQEPGCHTSGPHYAFKSVVPYPFNWNPACFQPYRLNGLGSGKDTCVPNVASREDVMEAFFNPSAYPLHHAPEALEAALKVAEHRKALGL